MFRATFKKSSLAFGIFFRTPKIDFVHVKSLNELLARVAGYTFYVYTSSLEALDDSPSLQTLETFTTRATITDIVGAIEVTHLALWGPTVESSKEEEARMAESLMAPVSMPRGAMHCAVSRHELFHCLFRLVLLNASTYTGQEQEELGRQRGH